MSARIVIFAKAPVAGRVKTRLIPVLGADGAAELAREMLANTIAEAKASGLPFELCTDPDPGSPEWAGWPAATAQGEGDLGARMGRAAERVTGDGEAILLVGSDCPDLSADRLRAAADALDTHDAVIHPAKDGGFVLIGLRRFDPSLFEGIAWSTATVAAETVARIRALGWALHVGETLRDVDEPGDLPASRTGSNAGLDSRFRGNDGKGKSAPMNPLPPYGQFLGLRTERTDGGALLFVMPFGDVVLGRPGYLHGGAIAGLLEFAALGTLYEALGSRDVTVKPINVSVNFMRGGTNHDTFAAAEITRLGKRVANVEARAWQRDRKKPIATAQMNVMLKR